MAAAGIRPCLRHVAGDRRPRRALARNLSLDDLPSREEEELSDATPGFDDAVLGVRDRALCQELERLAAAQDAARTVAVCWGATHMRAVIGTLYTRLGTALWTRAG